MRKYGLDTRLICADNGVKGVVVGPECLPHGDSGFVNTYDEWCIDDICVIVGE